MHEDTQNLFLLVDHAIETYTEWVNDSDVRYVTDKLERSIDQLCEYYALADIPAAVRPVAKAIDGLEIVWKRFKHEAQFATDPDGAIPGQPFSTAFADLARTREDAKPKPRRQLETIAELTEQKVTNAQICRIYEWVEADGTPQLWKLAEERAEPGKHSKGYVPPSFRAKEMADTRRKAIIESVRLQAERKHEAATAIAPEPVELLIEQGLCAKQIMKMKKVSLDEIAEVAEAHDLPMPPMEYGDVMSERQSWDKPFTEEQQRLVDAHHKPAAAYGRQAEPDVNPGETLTIEQQIVATFQSGLTEPRAIAEQVSTVEHPVSHQKVVAVIKRFETDPHAFTPVPV